jgi:radical SAM superfamily enzyme YgiQ (UPF0313 family)
VATRNAGHQVKFVDLMAERDDRSSLKEAIASFAPEVIGISVRNIDDQSMAKPRFLLDQVRGVVAACRSLSGARIVLGGAGYSIYPESALNYLEADFGIQGEGEASFPLLLSRLEGGGDPAGIPGLYVRGAGLQGQRVFEKELDRFGLPDAALSSLGAPDKEEFWMPVQSRRGCPMACSYCSTATIEGRAIRKRRPDSVLTEIANSVAAGFKRFFFVDNVFNIPERYAREVCLKILESGLSISWRCIIYPGRMDQELAGLLAKAGCTEVSLGFESGCERILRSMNKRYTLDDVRRTAEILTAAGIGRQGFLMLGGPGETRESVQESLAFADSLDLESLKVTVGIRIYPGTALAATALREGLILPGDDLLHPRFYLAPSLGDWLYDTVRAWAADRPHWLF